MLEDDWRELEADRRREHPELRGVEWDCNHSAGDLNSIKRAPPPLINPERRRGFLDARMGG
jgi:hypothetical protein